MLEGFTSAILLLCNTADWQFTFVDVGRPVVLGDSNIFENSSSKRNIDDGLRLEEDIHLSKIFAVEARTYLRRDCTFFFWLTVNVIKTTLEQNKEQTHG